MEDVLESIRRTVYRWVNTSVPLTATIALGGDTISVTTSHRFRAGDEVALFDPDTGLGEPHIIIEEIVDNTTIRFQSGIQASEGFGPGQGSMLMKAWNGNFIQAIFLGDPAVIPVYPSIAIMPGTESSEWLTLGVTTETYNVKVVTYVEADNQEDSYRYLLKVTKAIQDGMKKNIFPLIGPFTTHTVTADVAIGDNFLRVSDTTDLICQQKIVLENIHRAEELEILNIINGTTIEVCVPPANPYFVSESSKIIGLTRFIYNSWPSDIDYGYIHKGSLLHASTISWFGKETEVQTRGGWIDPQLT